MPLGSGAEPSSVLIVEDEAIVAMDLRRQLESHGYRVADIVGKAGAVLASVRENQPDLVLMDIHLPGAVDGITLAEQVWATQKIPVVFCRRSRMPPQGSARSGPARTPS